MKKAIDCINDQFIEDSEAEEGQEDENSELNATIAVDDMEFEIELEVANQLEERILPRHLKRMGCINHALINNIKAGIKNSAANSLIKNALFLLHKIKNSGICADLLKANNASLVLPPATRWSYLYDSLANMIKIKTIISDCCNILHIDNLLNSEYQTIEEITQILKKYKESIEVLESDKTFISKVVPCLENLRASISKKTL